MPRSYLDPPIPIAALATVPGKSALAVIRVAGAGCLDLLAPLFSRPEKLRSAPGHSLVHGHIVDPERKERIDEVLIAVFRAPSSSSGEDQVEISCHGSPIIVTRILGLLENSGFAAALPGEFTFRGFANGKLDLVEAEAVDELISAPGEVARVEALQRLGGVLSRRLSAARRALLEILAEAEVRLDYSEEDGSPSELFPADSLQAFRRDLGNLAATWTTGRLHADGARLVIAGPANAGKSSLFNLLVREERAIVSPEPGTTRDWIETGIELAGLPLRLIDTAGFREAPGTVEAIGQDRSRTLLAQADLAICLADASRGAGPEEADLLALRPDSIRVWNKIDLPDAASTPAGWIGISATKGDGFPALISAIEGKLRELEDPSAADREPRSAESGSGGTIIASLRQKRLLDRAAASIDGALSLLAGAGLAERVPLDAVALELRDAADAIGELTGEISSPEILDAIFSGFCLGK